MRWTMLVVWACWTAGLFAQSAPSKQEIKARALLARDKPYKAAVLCDHMLGRTPHPEFYAIRAEALNRIGEPKNAERDARTALQHFPNSAAALLQLAIAEQGQGVFDSARVHLEQVLQRDPSPEVRYRLALNYRMAKQCREAIAQLDEAWRAGARNAADSARIVRVKGECLAELGDSTGARVELDKAVAIAPDDPVNYNSRGYYGRAFFGDHFGAIKDYDRAIKINPNYSYAFNNRGWSWYKLGQKEKALADIHRAKKRKVFNPYVYRNLGVIALESGDSTAACMNLRRALDYGFTALYGDEVEQLMTKNCSSGKGAQVPVQAPNAPMDREQPKKPAPRTNAP